eukprot:scaffold803_cov310-Pinguiococcus_pyrenoidosus.AAC.178
MRVAKLFPREVSALGANWHRARGGATCLRLVSCNRAEVVDAHAHQRIFQRKEEARDVDGHHDHHQHSQAHERRLGAREEGGRGGGSSEAMIQLADRRAGIVVTFPLWLCRRSWVSPLRPSS